MAEEKNKQEIKQKEPKEKEQKKPQGRPGEDTKYFSIVRISQTDIPGNKSIFVGLTYIKGISWAVSNAMVRILKLDPKKKVSDMGETEIKKIEEFLKKPELPKFLLNRRNDFETGLDSHKFTNDLDMTREFDIRRLKKIRSYRGLRHATGQPTRGQSTKAHFRSKKNRKSVGVKRKKTVEAVKK